MNLAQRVPGPSQERSVTTPKPRKRQRKPSRLGAVFASALTWLFACALTGAALTVTGVWILAGTGWALITVGAFLFLIAGLLHVGISHG